VFPWQPQKNDSEAVIHGISVTRESKKTKREKIMRIIVEKSKIENALHRIGAIIQPRTTLAILCNILCEAKKDALTLTVASSEVRGTVTIPATVEQEGTTTIPFKRFVATISKLRGDQVSVSATENHHTSVEGGTAKIKLYGLDPKDYPEAPKPEGVPVTLPVDSLMRGLALTDFAVNPTEGRKVLQGVNVDIRPESVTFAATDGKRIAVWTAEAPVGIEEGSIVLNVPIASVSELKKFLPKSGAVTIRAGKSLVTFETPDGSFSSRLLEGTFPKYDQIIPKQVVSSFTIKSEKAAAALDLMLLVSDTAAPCVNISLDSAAMRFSAGNRDVGSGADSIEIEGDGNAELMLNPGFFADPFKRSGADELVLEYCGEGKPLRITDKAGFLYIQMPMQTKAKPEEEEKAE
jgi:DNA polymerase-3 subunit beta